MQHKPRLWHLYAIFPLCVGLLWLDTQITLSPQGHQLIVTGIMVLVFGCMALWVRRQKTATPDKLVRYFTYEPKRQEAMFCANFEHYPQVNAIERDPVASISKN